MEKRAFKRFSANIHTRLFYGNMVYTGIITNLSETGMFICTQIRFSVDSMLVATILIDRHALKLPIKIMRTVRSDKYYNCINGSGLGVILLDPPKDYLEFITKYNSLHESSDTNL